MDEPNPTALALSTQGGTTPEPEALPSMRTSEIEIDIDAAFARVRMQTRPGTQNEWLNEWVTGTATR